MGTVLDDTVREVDRVRPRDPESAEPRLVPVPRDVERVARSSLSSSPSISVRCDKPSLSDSDSLNVVLSDHPVASDSPSDSPVDSDSTLNVSDIGRNFVWYVTCLIESPRTW